MPLTPGAHFTVNPPVTTPPLKAQKHFQVSGASPVKIRPTINEKGKAGASFVKEVTVTLDQRGVTVNLVT